MNGLLWVISVHTVSLSEVLSFSYRIPFQLALSIPYHIQRSSSVQSDDFLFTLTVNDPSFVPSLSNSSLRPTADVELFSQRNGQHFVRSVPFNGLFFSLLNSNSERKRKFKGKSRKMEVIKQKKRPFSNSFLAIFCCFPFRFLPLKLYNFALFLIDFSASN